MALAYILLCLAFARIGKGGAVDGVPSFCTKGVGSVIENSERERGSGGRKFHTNVKLNLQLNQRSCFELDAERNGTEEKLFFVVSFVKYETQAAYKVLYTFAIPEIEPTCYCQCPNVVSSHCDKTDHNEDCEPRGLCAKTVYPDQKAHGCENQDEDKDATICCRTTVKAHTNGRYNVVEFKEPSAKATVRFEVYRWINSTLPWGQLKNVTASFSAVTNVGTRLSDEILKTHKVPQFKIETAVDPPDFVLETTGNRLYYYDKTRPFVMLAGLKKDGYHFLSEENGKLEAKNLTNWLGANFIPTINDCNAANNKQTVKFNTKHLPFFLIRNSSGHLSGNYSLDFPVQKQETQHIYRVKQGEHDVDDGSGHVVLEYSPASVPPIKVELQFSDVKKDQVLSEPAHSCIFDKFSATIVRNKHNSLFLNLTIQNGEGSFVVNVTQPNVTQPNGETDATFGITLPHPVNEIYTTKQTLPPSIRNDRQVCLSSPCENKFEKCQTARYVKEELHRPTDPNANIDTNPDCPNCNQPKQKESVAAWLNPLKWIREAVEFFGGSDRTVKVIQGIVVTIVVVLVIVILKVFCWGPLQALCGCAACITKPFRKRKRKKKGKEITLHLINPSPTSQSVYFENSLADDRVQLPKF